MVEFGSTGDALLETLSLIYTMTKVVFQIQPLSPLFLREDLGEFFKLKNLKTTFSFV